MSILPWRRMSSHALMVIPEDFDQWLKDTSGAFGFPVKWEKLQPSVMLQRAIEAKDEEALLRAFESCKALFKKAYRELQRGKYRAAARYYAMAGYGCTDFSMIERWGLRKFEDNLACDVYHSNYMRGKVSAREEREITEMLPTSAPCQYCGVMLVRPQTVQGRCPRCKRVQTYAEKDRNRIKGQVARSVFKDDFEKEREEYRDPLAAYAENRSQWAPSVQELVSLVRPYL